MPQAERVPVVAVGAHRVVTFQVQRRDGADGGRLLPDVEVAEAADLLQPVHLGRFFLEPPDEEHPAQELLFQLSVDAPRFSDCHVSVLFLSEAHDVFPADHRQETRGFFNDRFEDHEVALVVRELPEGVQPGAEHLEDLRAQGRGSPRR